MYTVMYNNTTAQWALTVTTSSSHTRNNNYYCILTGATGTYVASLE